MGLARGGRKRPLNPREAVVPVVVPAAASDLVAAVDSAAAAAEASDPDTVGDSEDPAAGRAP